MDTRLPVASTHPGFQPRWTRRTDSPEAELLAETTHRGHVSSPDRRLGGMTAASCRRRSPGQIELGGQRLAGLDNDAATVASRSQLTVPVDQALQNSRTVQRLTERGQNGITRLHTRFPKAGSPRLVGELRAD